MISVQLEHWQNARRARGWLSNAWWDERDAAGRLGERTWLIERRPGET